MIIKKKYKKIFKLFVITIIFSFNLSCNNQKISFIPIRDTAFIFDDNENKMYGITYYTNGKYEYCVYFNPSAKTIEFNGLKNNNIEYSIPLNSMDSIRNINENLPIYNAGLSFFVHNTDSIFIFLTETVTIYLIQRNGKIINRWNVDIELENHNKDYVLLHMKQIPLYFSNNKIYIMNTRMDIVLRTPEARKIYFSSTPDVTIDISKDPCNITNKTGKWPEIYRTGMDYDDCWPQRCVNNKGQLVYAFAVDHSLYIYNNDSLIKPIQAKSKYFTKATPYPDDSLGHFSFKKKYWVTESRYEKLIYDTYRDLYYKIVTHATEYENEDGMTVKSVSDKPWSVMIINADFEVLDEIIFDQNIYTYYYFIPTAKGILVSKKKDKSEKNINNINLTLFKITTE